MIRATYNRQETRLTVKGHAGSAPKGQDLICAAASILGFTAVACAEDNKDKYFPAITQHDGELRIECSPLKSYITPCRRMLDTVFTGMELLESEYPDFVRTERED